MTTRRYTFTSSPASDEVVVACNGRTIAGMTYDGECLHDYWGTRLSDQVLAQVDLVELIDKGATEVVA